MELKRQFRKRSSPAQLQWQFEHNGTHPLLARLYAARGLQPQDLETKISGLYTPDQMMNTDLAAQILADAIINKQRILIIADYDCDGATACAVGIRALRAMGANVDYMVPDRFTLGYGLTAELVELAAKLKPDLLVTVDNGIADVAGVNRAQQLEIATLITDHHLPGAQIPPATCIVNPNQANCPFPSKHLAGVGVIYYVMLALRRELRRRGVFTEQQQPNLAVLLDLVALGTVADVVKLDFNNRVLVSQGLLRIRQGKMQAGIAALFQAAMVSAERARSSDLGFVIGPRLNAAGRLQDMSLGIECLITDDPLRALAIAQQLQILNHQRRSIEATIQAEANDLVDDILSRQLDVDHLPTALALYDAGWHQGVIGIVAGRLKDRFHRPVFVFAGAENGCIKGSGRSIPGLHLRDILDMVHKRYPELMLRFGGHAAAAGLTIAEQNFPQFASAFTDVVDSLATEELLSCYIETDGPLESAYYNLPVAQMLSNCVWGQGIPPPLFADTFTVERQQILKDKHLKLRLQKAGVAYEAIYFNHIVLCQPQIEMAFSLETNSFRGMEQIQLNVAHIKNCHE